MKNTSIYQYIIENLDPEEQRFTQENLPDEPHPSVPHPLGTEDAFWFTTSAPSDDKNAGVVYKLMQDYLSYPDQPHKQRLYETLASLPIVAIAEPISEKLQEQGITEALLALARSFFYNSRDRGPLKFAYIIFGLYGVERLKSESPELWEDMVKVAQCEEFTYFFLFACNLTNVKPFKEIWRLLGCTQGWGKVFVVEAAECRDEAQELWLIQHGMDVSVDYPPLSVYIMESAHLAWHLEQQDLDERTFKAAGPILNAFLVLLASYDETILENNLNTTALNPVRLLQNYLRHALVWAKRPEELLQLVNLSMGLRNLEQEDSICIMTKNDIELLIARCDSIVYAQDWQPYIKTHLIHNDRVNYELCDFACEMDMDIWQQLFDYLCAHPLEYKLLPYLFSYADMDYQKKILRFVEQNLGLYSTEESALLVPLRYLAHNPGLGEQVIIAALTSIYDWPRGVACAVLDGWSREYVTEPMRQALQQGLSLSNNQVVTERIKALLTGREFDVRMM